MVPYVFINGQIENGKDEVAQSLRQTLLQSHGLAYDMHALADPPKNLVCAAFNVTRDFIEKWKRIPVPPPGWHRSMRDLLIHVGDGFRQWQNEIWLTHLFLNAGPFIVNDWRYLERGFSVQVQERFAGDGVAAWIREFHRVAIRTGDDTGTESPHRRGCSRSRFRSGR